MLDSTGLCLFARPPVIADPQLMVDMLNGRYGWGWTKEDLDQLNRDVLRTELEFNRRAGITAADYRIPEYMREEPLAPHNAAFDVPDSELGRGLRSPVGELLAIDVELFGQLLPGAPRRQTLNLDAAGDGPGRGCPRWGWIRRTSG